MAISKELIEAVDNNDVLAIRLLLKNSLILDPSGDSFSEMINYANKRVNNLIVDHDGELFRKQEEWDKDYFNEQTVKIVNNFSKERIELLMGISKKLDSDNEKKAETQEMCSRLETQRVQNGLNITRITGGTVTVVGVGLLISGLVIADVPVAISIIGGTAIGVGAYLFLKK